MSFFGIEIAVYNLFQNITLVPIRFLENGIWDVRIERKKKKIGTCSGKIKKPVQNHNDFNSILKIVG